MLLSRLCCALFVDLHFQSKFIGEWQDVAAVGVSWSLPSGLACSSLSTTSGFSCHTPAVDMIKLEATPLPFDNLNGGLTTGSIMHVKLATGSCHEQKSCNCPHQSKIKGFI